MLSLPPERFELSTPGLQDQCSNPWAMEALEKRAKYWFKTYGQVLLATVGDVKDLDFISERKWSYS